MTDSSSRARRAPSVSQVHSEQVEVGHYLVLPHVMGKGAWSVVHAAIDMTKEANATSSKGGSGSLTSLDQSNAVAKIISKASLREKRSLTEGEELREISIMRSMPRHRNLVRMLDTFETEHFYYIFLEKLPNGDLCDYILNTPTGKLPEAQCRKFLRQIVTGLSALHNAGIAHRDVKPENMLLDAEDELRTTDFGLAKRHTRSRGIVSVPEEMSRELVGTLRYAAPEMFVAQFHGVPYDAFISDVWSVGVCLYIMFTGSFPYSAGADADERQTYDVLRNSDLVLPTEISRDGVNLVKKLLCKDPRARIRLHDVERHPWMRSSTAEAAEEPLTDDHTPVDFTDVSQLQTELQRQKEMIRELREELTKERGARERLEKLVREYERNASYMTPNSTSRRGVTPTRPLRSSMAPNNVARTNSPQRLPNSVTTPMRNSPKRPHGVTSSILQSQGVGAPSIPARMATASPTRKMLHSTLAARGTQLPTNSPGRSGVTMSGRLVSSGVRQNLSRASPVTRFGTPVGSRHNSATIYSGRTATPTRSGGMSRRGTSTARADLSSNTTNDPLQIGQEVHYKGGRAVVRFYGPTSFAEGIWIGLELELPNGLNDGSCFIDQKRYFTCPEGHGVFVRKSQITL